MEKIDVSATRLIGLNQLPSRHRVRIDNLANQAYDELINSGLFSYSAFVALFDNNLEAAWSGMSRSGNRSPQSEQLTNPTLLTMFPIRANPELQLENTSDTVLDFKRLLISLWWKLPESFRSRIKPLLKKLLRA